MPTNYVLLIGTVGKDPEVKYNDNGTVIAKTTLATHETWKDRSGQQKEETIWHNLECWGDFAKAFEERVRKGIRMTIQGKLVTETWDDDMGKKHYRTYVRIREFEIHNKK